MNKPILFIVGTLLAVFVVVHCQHKGSRVMVIRPQARPMYNMYRPIANAAQSSSFSQQDGYLYALAINQQYTQANEAQNLLRTVQAIRQATYDTRLGGLLNLAFTVALSLLATNSTGAVAG
ncbi:uncharacterized protein LOC133190123 [Saccostrea echinata]|uniref:uncharacterized protein LOC133190123 n=1 Tax=Saccostrea echinata TaxID=191078 RepID=UPI002A837682|nr:uncharacterized protein LOC133190123 [Saccostrea echinata]